jgi:[acyl-carrier-protein] S-malonyltransferase
MRLAGPCVRHGHINAPGQVVIAGSAAAVERAIFACKEAGAKRAMPLPVSVPSHCALMKPAADQLAETLNATSFHAAEMPVINNVDVAMETAPEQIREALIRQLYSPVRWVETIQALKEQGVSHVYECGPGKVLSGLIKRIDRDIAARPLETGEAFEVALKGE